MARASSLKTGDTVLFYGKICKVTEVQKGTEVITIEHKGDKGFVSYIYAWDCRKIG